MQVPSRGAQLRFAQLVLAAGALAYLLQSGQLAADPLRAVAGRWPWWIAAQLCFAGALSLATLRWHTLLRIHGLQVRLRDTAALVLIGMCFNQVAPGATGGDVAKAIALAAEHRERRAAALLSIAMDRVLGLLTLAAAVLIAACADWTTVLGHAPLALFAAGAAGALLGAAALGVLGGVAPLRRALRLDRFAARLGRVAWLGEILAALASYRHSPRLLLRATLCSLCLNAFTIATNLCLAHAVLGSGFAARSLVSVVLMVHLAAGVPITPFGNAGVLETLYAELLGYAGIAQGAVIGLLQRSLYWTWALVGAGVLLLRRLGARRVELPVPEIAQPPETRSQAEG